MIETIAFDADDTLWDNESRYQAGKQRFTLLLQEFCSPEEAGQRLDETEMRNVSLFGYGVKSFALSMIETAIAISDGRFSGEGTRGIVEIAKDILAAPLGIYERVEETLQALAGRYRMMLITKGDPFEQEMKIARTGLGKYFEHIEIVGEKAEATYRSILQRYRIHPDRFIMVGNSMRSDVLPVLRLGGRAVYIPQENTWFHEHSSEDPQGTEGYYELEYLWQLPELLKNLEK